MSIQGSPAFESISPGEIARAINLFNVLKQFRLKLGSGDEEVLERAFEFHVQGILEKLDARLQQVNDAHEKQLEVILARHGMYDATMQQVAHLCHSSKQLFFLSGCIHYY